MRTIILSLACLLLGACAGQSGKTESLAKAMPAPVEMARDAESHGNWKDAARHWEQAAARAPDDEAIALRTVRALRLANSCGRASGYLEQLFKAGAENADVLLETGKCHLVSGRYQAAIAALTAALAVDPQRWETATVLATAYDLMEQPSAARTHHDRAIAQAPQNPVVLSNAALSRALAGELEEGIVLMRQAAATPSASPRVRMNLAFLEAVAGNGDVATMMARQESSSDNGDSVKLLQRIANAARHPQAS